MRPTIGILTGGGDCPGLNAVIRGIAKSAFTRHRMEVVGFLDGFEGLIERRYVRLTPESVAGILTQGGTILGSTNRSDPFSYVNPKTGETADRSETCVKLYRDMGLVALICLGGDGTQQIAGTLAKQGMNVIGVPKTIDKDVAGTDETFGFDSARTMATDAVDRLHSTAESHSRVMVVEVMGRNAGWLALESCIAGGGDICLIPELPFSLDRVAASVDERLSRGKRFSIVVVSEGARLEGGAQSTIHKEGEKNIRLGGIGHFVAAELEKRTGRETRVTVLGHLQRGGAPTAYDRVLATRFAVKAMELIGEGRNNEMVALQAGQMTSVPISEVVGKQRLVPLDSPLIDVARSVGTSFGSSLLPNGNGW